MIIKDLQKGRLAYLKYGAAINGWAMTQDQRSVMDFDNWNGGREYGMTFSGAWVRKT